MAFRAVGEGQDDDLKIVRREDEKAARSAEPSASVPDNRQ